MGLKLFEKSNKSSLRRFLFRNLSTWGFTQSGDFFVDATFRPGGGAPRKSGVDDTPKRMVFKTDQGKMIAEMLSEYADAIVASGRYDRSSSVGGASNTQKQIGAVDQDDTKDMTSDDVDYDEEIDVHDDDVSTKRSTNETGTMSHVAMSVLRMQGLFRGFLFRMRVRKHAAALLIQSAWRGHRARIALHMMIDHMTNLLISKGMDVLKEVREIDDDKKVVAREDLV